MRKSQSITARAKKALRLSSLGKVVQTALLTSFLTLLMIGSPANIFPALAGPSSARQNAPEEEEEGGEVSLKIASPASSHVRRPDRRANAFTSRYSAFAILHADPCHRRASAARLPLADACHAKLNGVGAPMRC